MSFSAGDSMVVLRYCVCSVNLLCRDCGCFLSISAAATALLNRYLHTCRDSPHSERMISGYVRMYPTISELQPQIKLALVKGERKQAICRVYPRRGTINVSPLTSFSRPQRCVRRQVGPVPDASEGIVVSPPPLGWRWLLHNSAIVGVGQRVTLRGRLISLACPRLAGLARDELFRSLGVACSVIRLIRRKQHNNAEGEGLCARSERNRAGGSGWSNQMACWAVGRIARCAVLG